LSRFESLPGVIEAQKLGDKIRLRTNDPSESLKAFWRLTENEDLKILSLNTVGSSLEDVSLELTGMEMKKEIIRNRKSRR